MKITRVYAIRCLLAMAIAAGAMQMSVTVAAQEQNGFSFNDKKGEYLDILLDGKIAARYMYAYDKSSSAKLNETYKPYLHVFDAEGKAPITKGPGGQYTHHRGIFIGWNKIGFGGKTYDRWHMKGGEIVHQKFLEQKASADQATIVSLTNWNDESGKPIIEEERTMTIRRAPAPGRILVDFSAKLKAPNGDVTLDGDPEHSGVHFRPANEVIPKETVYVFPKEGAKPTADLDYPWVGETFTLNSKRYSVVEMNHPDNPKNTKFSAYRDYARFGAFFKSAIKSGEALTIKYRFLIAEGEMPAIDMIEKCWDEYIGAKSPTPVPKTSVVSSAPKSAPKAAAAPKDANAAEKPAKPKKEAAPKKTEAPKEPVLK
ncbi:MAG: PmoA family protein [Candidatus Sumerlaeota bacterium]|nr:PmoA family protein [Candidatus Sumerlaeota bacterium]